MTRVIDVIAWLQAHDPCAPFEVWVENGDSFENHAVIRAQQITPLYMKGKGMHYDPTEENSALPVVLFCDEGQTV